MIIEAAYYKKLDHDNMVHCLLCPAECRLRDGKKGICSSRFNDKGILRTNNFGELVSLSYDPIEKKPLYHFYPGSVIFSTGANGCNFNCQNCQNWEISQTEVPTRYVSPDDLVKIAGARNSIGIAYTYTEPLIWFEYILQSGRLIRDAGLKNVLVTNGYINAEPLNELLPLIDAANIDLKGMKPEFYKKVCKGKLEPVLENITRFHSAGVHIEITNLVIPGLNDTDADFQKLIDFIAGIDSSIPLHFSAYYPTYKMTNPPTSPASLLRAYEMASAKLDYVYLGNVNLPGKSDTICPKCKTAVIKRRGYLIDMAMMANGCCPHCGNQIGIIV